MKNLALDIWDDMRAKRLWPVAALLLLALIAIPVFVVKPAEEPPAQALQAQAPTGQSKPAVALIDEASRGSSDLGVFGRKDPFRPPAAALKPSTSVASSAAGSPAGPSPSQPAGPVSGGGGGSPPVHGGGGGLSPAAGKPSPGPPRTARPRTIAYTYLADVTLRRDGRSRRIRRLNRLDMLPSQESPLLIFLGVTSDGDHAVFLVDSTLQAEGEGRCAPKASECATLTIGAGSEHAFADANGNAFSLRINEIRKVRVSRASASSRRRVRARTATGTPRRFVPPVLADFITMASPQPKSSPPAADRR